MNAFTFINSVIWACMGLVALAAGDNMMAVTCFGVASVLSAISEKGGA